MSSEVSIVPDGLHDLHDLQFSLRIDDLSHAYDAVSAVRDLQDVSLFLKRDKAALSIESRGLHCVHRLPLVRALGIPPQGVTLITGAKLFDAVLCNKRLWSELKKAPDEHARMISFKKVVPFLKGKPDLQRVPLRIELGNFEMDWVFEQSPAVPEREPMANFKIVQPERLATVLKYVAGFASKDKTRSWKSIDLKSGRAMAATNESGRRVKGSDIPDLTFHVERECAGPLSEWLRVVRGNECRFWVSGDQQGLSHDDWDCHFPSAFPLPELDAGFDEIPAVRFGVRVQDLNRAIYRVVSQVRGPSLKDPTSKPGNAPVSKAKIGKVAAPPKPVTFDLQFGEKTTLSVATRVRGGEATAVCDVSVGSETHINAHGHYSFEVADARLLENVCRNAAAGATVHVGLKGRVAYFDFGLDKSQCRTLVSLVRPYELRVEAAIGET